MIGFITINFNGLEWYKKLGNNELKKTFLT